MTTPDGSDVAERRALVLIHGVGLPAADIFGEGEFKRWFPARQTLPIDWHQVVEQPSGFLVFNRRQVAALMRGFIGAAARNQHWSVVQRVLYTALRRWLYPAPGVLLLLIVVAVTALGGQLQRSAPFFASVVQPWIRLSNAVVPSDMLMRHQSWLSAYVAAAAVVAALLFLAAVASNGWHPLTALRQIVLLLLWPVVFAGCLLVSPLLLLLLPGYVLAAFLDNRKVEVVTDIHHLTVESGLLLDMGLLILALAVTAAVLAVLYFVLRPVGWALKVAADVVCFMGDEEYAAKLKDHIRARLTEIVGTGDQTVVIAAHSLGTAIVVETLLESKINFGEANVVLLTMGSPLRRLLQRFFADTWPTAEALASQLRYQYERFVWINVYRPWDPIGGRIFQKPLSYCVDTCTDQWSRPGMSAHTNYWDDETVARTALAAYEQLHPADTRVPRERAPGRVSASRAIAETALEWKRFRVAGAITILLALWLPLNWFFLATSDRDYHRLGSTGETVPGWMGFWTETVRVDRGVYVPVNSFILVFQPHGQDRPVLAGVNQRYLNSRAAAAFIKRHGKPRTFYRRGGLSVDGQGVPTTVRYLPDRPEVALPEGFATENEWAFILPLGLIGIMTGGLVLGMIVGAGMHFLGELYVGQVIPLEDAW